MTNEESFGAKIKEYRQHKGWSVRKAALDVGISRYRLDELEIGRSRSTGNPTHPSRATVVRLAEVYGVPKDFLLDLAGFAREHPDLTDSELLYLDLFRGLSADQQAMVLRIIQAVPNPPSESR